jgi:hypothetical protein
MRRTETRSSLQIWTAAGAEGGGGSGRRRCQQRPGPRQPGVVQRAAGIPHGAAAWHKPGRRPLQQGARSDPPSHSEAAPPQRLTHHEPVGHGDARQVEQRQRVVERGDGQLAVAVRRHGKHDQRHDRAGGEYHGEGEGADARDAHHLRRLARPRARDGRQEWLLPGCAGAEGRAAGEGGGGLEGGGSGGCERAALRRGRQLAAAGGSSSCWHECCQAQLAGGLPSILRARAPDTASDSMRTCGGQGRRGGWGRQAR